MVDRHEVDSISGTPIYQGFLAPGHRGWGRGAHGLAGLKYLFFRTRNEISVLVGQLVRLSYNAGTRLGGVAR